jgi:hypothetical protein
MNMGIFRDHAITKTLRDGNLRNDPEVLDLLCDVIESVDGDMDKVGELVVSPLTDNKLEMLAVAVDRVEQEMDSSDEDEEDEDFDDEDEDEEDEDEDEDFLDDEDEEEKAEEKE